MINRVSKHVYRALFIWLFLFSVPISTAYAADNLLEPEEIIKRLQVGGYILYMRHASTDHSQQDKDLSDLNNCALQRNLSPQGIAESKIIGAAFKSLSIKIGDIYTSPYCRCIDTAKIAFGHYNVVYDLRASSAVDQDESTRIIEVLKQRLSKIPQRGVNTVLVGHTTNLRELTKIWPKPEGVTHIFEPFGDNKYRHLGHIKPTEWSLFRDTNK